MNLLSVEKPARYLGNEMGSVCKVDAEVRFALAFPDVYEVGMSHVGFRILYEILNGLDRIAGERVFAPWPDREAQMATSLEPLATLESATPLAQCDIIGFTLQYELSYTNILNMLRLAGIPFLAEQRTASFPLIIGGGPCACNPEALAPFFDAFLLGDGEDAIREIAETVRTAKRDGLSKAALLEQLSAIEGMYIPSFFDPQYHPDGTIAEIVPLHTKTSVKRRFVTDLESAPYPLSPIVPFMKTIHDRVALEVARGCTRGCRFCQAGYIYRPVRERSPDTILHLAEQSLHATGYDELSLLSLSTGDYSCIASLLSSFMARFAQERVAISLPSLRVGTLTEELIEEIKKVRKTGFTLAPEAGSERMRTLINKGITEEDLLTGARHVYAAGWRLIKLYFMIGLPGETLDDVMQIPPLARQVKDQAKVAKTSGEVNVAVSTFVPKAHTPFQWEPQISMQETKERQRLLHSELKRRKLAFKWQDSHLSFMEGVFARGDRRLAPVLQRAVELGCRFDGWGEHFSLERWMQAFQECGIQPEWYLRQRSIDENLPWDHLDYGVSREFLRTERDNAFSAIPTPDCRNGECSACGVCDFARVVTRLATPSARQPGETPPPAAGEAVRIRVRFSKTGMMRYLSHLELINLFTRAVSRAGVPILFSQGFHPHPRFSFATATSVGIESTAEYMDLFCDRSITADLLKERLNRVLPKGMVILDAIEISEKHTSLSVEIAATKYRVGFVSEPPADLARQVEEFLILTSYPMTRIKKKGDQQQLDLRTELIALELRDNLLDMTVRRGKPVEFARAITGITGLGMDDLHIDKYAVIFD